MAQLDERLARIEAFLENTPTAEDQDFKQESDPGVEGMTR